MKKLLISATLALVAGLLALGGGQAQATVGVVHCVPDISIDPSCDDGHATIQEAIDDADPGEIVLVGAGTYNENLSISTSLTLKAASQPVIDCSDRATLGLTKTDGCIEVTADNVIIQGFKLIGYDPTGESWSDQKSSSKFSTIKVTSGADGLKVKDNEFTGTSKAAVGLLIDDDCDDVEFTGNTVTDYLQGVAGHKGVDNLLVEDNEFSIPIAENTVLDPDQAYGYGVQLWHGNNLQVLDNTFTGSWDTATGDYEDPLALCNHYAVSTFTTYFASAYGWPDIVGDIHISNNEMTNLYLGVGSFAGGGEIEYNDIRDNLLGLQLGQVSGIWATAPTAGLSIRGNHIGNNKRGIWAQSFVLDGIAAHDCNNIVGNTEYGVINDDPENDVFDAEGNWWGAADGPSDVGPGSGDAVSSNVDFDPWEAHYCYGGVGGIIELPVGASDSSASLAAGSAAAGPPYAAIAGAAAAALVALAGGGWYARRRWLR